MSKAARSNIKLTDDDIVAHFARRGYQVTIFDLAFTSETVDDFQEARLDHWHRAGHLVDYQPGLLIVERPQPRAIQRTRDIVVISLGNARVVMGVEDLRPLSDIVYQFAHAMVPEPLGALPEVSRRQTDRRAC